MLKPNNPLAKIEELPAQDQARILSLGSNLFHNFLLVLYGTSPMVTFFSAILSLSISVWFWPLALLLFCATVFLVVCVSISQCYPEWPINYRLMALMNQAVKRRADAIVRPDQEGVRFAEFVPLERSRAVKLDTAIDVMLVRVDDSGLRMEGDRCRYFLPSESIVNVSLEDQRPLGWLVKNYYIVVLARTESGITSIRFALRDFKFGSLKPSRRELATNELAQKIASIACGVAEEPEAIIAEDNLNPYLPPLRI